jgi:hypothetical protein
MRRIRAFFFRLAGFVNRYRRGRALADEMENHLQLHIEDNLRSGMTPVEARRQAADQARRCRADQEIYRDRRGIPALETPLLDVRNDIRAFHKTPGFTALAIAALALATGANTAMFTLWDVQDVVEMKAKGRSAIPSFERQAGVASSDEEIQAALDRLSQHAFESGLYGTDE